MTLIAMPSHPNLDNCRTAAEALKRMKRLLQIRHHNGINRRRFLRSWDNLRRQLEHTPEYQKFRLDVLRRDKFRCQFCGSSGHTVHHRKRVAMAVHLALDAGNGVTICDECHAKEHPHLRRSRAA